MTPWNKKVTTRSTVYYARYTRIIHCRPCCYLLIATRGSHMSSCMEHLIPTDNIIMLIWHSYLMKNLDSLARFRTIYYDVLIVARASFLDHPVYSCPHFTLRDWTRSYCSLCLYTLTWCYMFLVCFLLFFFLFFVFVGLNLCNRGQKQTNTCMYTYVIKVKSS